jgi:hypothetical protein
MFLFSKKVTNALLGKWWKFLKSARHNHTAAIFGEKVVKIQG